MSAFYTRRWIVPLIAALVSIFTNKQRFDNLKIAYFHPPVCSFNSRALCLYSKYKLPGTIANSAGYSKMLHEVRVKTAHILHSFLPLALLVGLLLFSSCKLRVPLQEYFQTPVSASLNLAKATVGTQTPCYVVSETTPAKSIQKKYHLLPLLAVLRQEITLPVAGTACRSISQYFSRGSLSEPIPLYILYRKMKLSC
ncbi:hypothetical protein C8N40_104110 [Pontibacter mucosus]|uniref:Uncharacterized protein n=1 Tax=Pontibacter mucosus TaxID=1649266 RepID=A0A2T5YJ82_9BACT|nr:hypothetical protein C8N40_104110 [Pontibacter mucosus]